MRRTRLERDGEHAQGFRGVVEPSPPRRVRGRVELERGDIGGRRSRPLHVEDVAAETDMNVVVTGRGSFVEVQGTAEGAPFDRDELNLLLDLALLGSRELDRIQREALEKN